MKRVSLSAKSGQGTLEYILMTALVVGIVMTIFNAPLKAFLANYKSRQTEYTNVVSQRNMGIPLRWFGGNYPNPGGGVNAGGATAGGVNAGGATAGGVNAGAPVGTGNAQDPNANNGQGANGGDNGGADTQGDSPGGGGAGGPGAQANNSLLRSGSSRTASNTRGRRGGINSGEDEENAEGGEVTPGTTGRGRGSTELRQDGSLTEEELANETEEQRQARIKAVESGESLREERELFGNSKRRVREGSCGDLDIKVILQIAFVIALFFLLASMLFQKRGGKD